MAYVIAHEVAHHVQNQLGISGKVQQLQARGGESEGNKLSVRLELQADYLAGVWVHHAQVNKRILEKGDLEEALHAASRIGDDYLQKRAAVMFPRKASRTVLQLSGKSTSSLEWRRGTCRG